MKVSVTLFGHRTSLTLEPEFYEGLKEIAKEKKIPVHTLLEQIDNQRKDKPLSAFARIYVLNFYKGRVSTGE